MTAKSEKPTIIYNSIPLIERGEKQFINNNKTSRKQGAANLWHRAGYEMALFDVMKLIDDIEAVFIIDNIPYDKSFQILRKKIIGDRVKTKRRSDKK